MPTFNDLPYDILRLIILAALPRPVDADDPQHIRDACRLTLILKTVCAPMRTAALTTPRALSFIDCIAPYPFRRDPNPPYCLNAHTLEQHLRLSEPHPLHIRLDTREPYAAAPALLSAPSVTARWGYLGLRYLYSPCKWLEAFLETDVVFPALHTAYLGGVPLTAFGAP